MENFVDKDQTQINKYFQDKTDALKKTYGGRIQYIMLVPTVSNIYREIKEKDDGTLDVTEAELESGNIDASKKLDQTDPKVCPLYQAVVA